MSGVVWFFFVSAGVMYFVALAIKVEQIITLLGKIRDELVMANNPAVRFNPRDLKINIPLYRETHEPFQQDEAPR